MRIVLDTNVLVSALLTPHGTCAQVVALVRDGQVLPVVDDRVLAEYREVLSRPRFAVAKEAVAELLALIEEAGAVVIDPPAHDGRVPDPDDLPFIEVAMAGHAGAVVTGNRTHFPADLGVLVLLPAELLDRLGEK